MTDTILFDMDGTLIDTEKYYNRCWVAAIREAGYAVTAKEALAFRSLGRPFAPALFREMFGEGVDYPGIRSRRKELMRDMIREEGLSLKPGVSDVLAAVRERGMQAVIATATDHERTREYLTHLGIYDRFDLIVSAVQVKQGKPAPDVYLYACEQAGRKPDTCIAVEDSPNGVRSAASAGCRVVMVPDLSEPDEALKPLIYRKADSLMELAAWIRTGCL